MNKTNQTITLGNRLIVGYLVMMICSTLVLAAGRSRGSASRGSIRHSSSSRRSAPSRSSSARTQPSSLQRQSNSRAAITSRQSAPSRSSSLQSRSTLSQRQSSVTAARTRPTTGVNRNINTSNRNVNRNINTSNRNVNRNVNVNRNINVNSHHHNHWNDREDARRDWMRYRTVNHLIRAGTYWATRPKYSTAVVVTGSKYYYWGGMYYVSSGSGYVVVSPPPTAVVYAIPVTATPVYVGSTPYYYYGGTYYVPTTKPADKPKGTETTVNVNVSADASGGETKPEKMDALEMTKDDSNYEVVAPPVGATVPYLPDEAKEETVGGKKYFVHKGTYYRPFASDGETIYMIVKDPKKK